MERSRERPDGGRTSRTDPLLAWEAGLALVLFVLFIILFLLPAAQTPFRPHWFAGPVLAVGLFGVLILDRRRRRERTRRMLRELHSEETSEGPPPP